MNQERDILRIPPEQLGQGTSIRVDIVDTEDDVYHDCAWAMFQAIVRGAAERRHTVLIVPVGPVGQYRRLARLCNREGVSCRHVVMINMDEYLTDDGRHYIPYEHPLSFRRFMDEEFYQRLDPDKTVPPEQRIFPDPARPEAIGALIQQLGGVDICFGGIGINGHVAFNEPPEPGDPAWDPAVFRELPTRVVRLDWRTRLINAVTAARGDLEAIPPVAVTVGMKEILASREIRIYMNRPWQPAIARRWIHGPVTPAVPASFLQQHGRVTAVLARYVAEVPVPQLR